MKLKRYLHIALLMLAVNASMKAQKVGTTSMQFLKVIPEARGAGMADALVSLSSGINSIFWNPSGLAEIKQHEFEATYIDWIFDTYQTSIAYGIGIKKYDLGIGIQFQYINYGEIEETRVDHLGFIEESGYYNPGLTGRVFKPKAWLIGISLGKALTDRFTFGLGVKYAMEMLWNQSQVTLINPAGYEEIYNTYGKALLFDFGVNYKTGFRTVTIGASVQNFGPQVTYAKEKFPAPLTFRLGISGYVIGEGALLANNKDIALVVSYDIMHPNDYDQQMHLGCEFSFKEILFLRMGKKFNYDSENLTFGAGLKFNTNFGDVTFNYCYSPLNKYLGNIQKISVGLKVK